MKCQILELLEIDTWPGYEAIAEELEFKFGIKTTPEKVKEELKELYQIGLVGVDAVCTHDLKFNGTGYFAIPDYASAKTMKMDKL